MKVAVPREELDSLVLRQLANFFLVREGEHELLSRAVSEALERCEYCFSCTDNKYYRSGDETFFNPFHAGQYCIFLYFLSVAVSRLERYPPTLADRVYYLNRTLNSVDLFYEIELPRVVMLDHPLGSVMGRARYGEHFRFAQACTVGNNRGVYPVIGTHVTMMSGSKIIGNCRVGDHVVLSANTYVCDTDIPSRTIVFGSSPDLVFKPLR